MNKIKTPKKKEKENKYSNSEFIQLKDLGLTLYFLTDDKINPYVLVDSVTKNMIIGNKFHIKDTLAKLIIKRQFLDREHIESKDLSLIIDYQSVFISDITYLPIKDLIIREGNKIYLNLFEKSILWANTSVNNQDINPLKHFQFTHQVVSHLCDHKQERINYFYNWLAHTLQFPNIKKPTAFIFQGIGGTGKSSLFKYVLKPILTHNAESISLNTLSKSSTNEWLINKILLFCEEVMNQENKQEIPQLFKHYIADEYISLNRMYAKPLSIRNFSNFIFCSNERNPIKIDDNDRRYIVYSQKTPIDKDIISNLSENQRQENINFCQFLMNYQVDKKSVFTPLETEEKQDIVSINRNSAADFYYTLKDKDKMKELQFDLTNTYNINSNDTLSLTFIRSQFLYKEYIKFCENTGYNHKFAQKSFTRELNELGVWKDYFNDNKNTQYNAYVFPHNFFFEKLEVETTDLSEAY